MEAYPVICSGALVLSKKTKRFLLLKRTQEKTFGQWGLVGGKKEIQDLNTTDTLTREIKEELGILPTIIKIFPLDSYNNKNFTYNTFVILVKNEFMPVLNIEHSSYAWCKYKNWPSPLHQGLKFSLNNKINKIKLELLLSLI